MFGGSHESDFHNVTRYGSKMCHRSVTGVTQPSVVHDRGTLLHGFRGGSRIGLVFRLKFDE